ncbi:MAG TPA: thioredoxin domain-containing protein [Longimicrobiales bacterium]|nr:thioredoxin domain-containing protein [Longimicrobiales bacterium]
MAQRQRKGTPAQKSGGNTMFYIVLGVIALGGILAIAYAMGGSGGAATEMVDLEVADAEALYEQATPIRLGADDAPVKIVEFADYQCPGCRAFGLQVKPRIMPYIEDGRAQFVFYDFPLGGAHVHAFLAARAARCAGEQELGGQGGYWTYHDKLYQEQSSWSPRQSVVDDFVDYAEEVGLDRGAFDSCLRSDRFADVVTANRLLGEELGVRSTPTVLVNNRQVGGVNIQQMGDNLLQLMEEVLGASASAN